MIQKYCDTIINNKAEIIQWLRWLDHSPSYGELVKRVVEVINLDGEYGGPDPSQITTIDHGDYQGTLLYVVPEIGYQPSAFWALKVSYGSCSGCDTLQAICGYRWPEEKSEQDLNELYTLMLHLVQSMKEI
jgi:hypothetical protein